MRRAVLVTAFNRVDKLTSQIEFLENSNVDFIYIFCDGPRFIDRNEDTQVTLVQNLAHKFSSNNRYFVKIIDSNLGCKRAIEEAISWFFCTEEFGAILEDDVAISNTGLETLFELLQRFREKSNIGSVTVCSYVPYSALRNPVANLRMSNYVQSIAWGTWRQVWNLYSHKEGSDLGSWSLKRLIDTRGLFPGIFWWRVMNRVKDNKLDTWDVPWLAHCWNFGLKTLVTNHNYALHTGWGVQATHTRNTKIPDWAKTTVFEGKLEGFNMSPQVDYGAEWWMAHNFYNESLLSMLRAYVSRYKQRLIKVLQPKSEEPKWV